MNTLGHYPKLPLKFILLWIVNIGLLLAISFGTGLQERLVQIQIRNLAYVYSALGAVLALLEQALWDKLKENLFPKE